MVKKYSPKLTQWMKTLALILFIAYFAFLLYRLFFFAYGHYYRIRKDAISFNLMPFRTIHLYITNYTNQSIDVGFLNLFGNIIAFMPMGFLVPLIFERAKGFKRILIIISTTSIIIEIAQLWLRLGIADIDDVILNSLGGVIGYVLPNLTRRVIKLLCANYS